MPRMYVAGIHDDDWFVGNVMLYLLYLKISEQYNEVIEFYTLSLYWFKEIVYVLIQF